MSFEFNKLTNAFLGKHLKYVENTEPPRLFHVWSALTAVAACMQRQLYLETGIGNIYGNMYVWLVGPPGTRKGHAINPAITIMQKATDVRFAPDDTGGQRQGLIKSMIEDDIDDTGLNEAEALDVDNIANVELRVDAENRHVLFINATELGSFIGQNNLELIRFLIKMWDGEDYQYRLRQSKDTLTDPLMSMLAATTPTDIADLLPPASIGGGFMSRCVLVYAPHKEKTVPLSKAKLNRKYEQALADIYKYVFYQMRGPMTLSNKASALLDSLYMRDTKINDTRFIYYSERRQTHLVKLIMSLAAARQSMVIEEQDVADGELLLEETEKRMPDALGQFGLSPVAVAQQKMLEYCRFAKEPVSERVLWAVMQRDMKLVDFKNALAALINADKIVPIDTKTGKSFMYKDETTRTLEAIGDEGLDLLLSDKGSKFIQ